MRIVSWNVNGLRACVRKGFLQFLDASGADFVGIQELRAFPEQLDPQVRNPDGWYTGFHPAVRGGYSGVAFYSRFEPDAVETSLGEARFDDEGRFIMARFGRTSIASVYFPKGSGKERDNSRVPYKMDFYRAVFERIERARGYGPVIVMGDYNTAHEEIDLARPTPNKKASGFLPEERVELSRWVGAGWVDVFRRMHPDEPGHYTWWRQWGDARKQNVGWRIDYLFCSPSASRRVSDSFIWPEIEGSDHCPLGVEFD
jgi:exodeoxyribonuclease-3